ncbi:hypothetical protein BDF22DRAFT_683574 [Syncephalis plumigaleata]|nr:hypothetical protein BDF22DRAFT_683574 [Syncephalis plumigaleata]
MTVPSRHIVVLGGGISGLSVAYHLLRLSPHTRVTLVEAKHRVGGWIESRTVNERSDSILCETGPRTLRPAGRAGLATLQLVKELKLDDQLVVIPRTSLAAKNRFIYGNHRLHLMRPWSILQSSYMRPLLWSMTKEPFRTSPNAIQTVTATATAAMEDESIRDFISRRFSPIVADRIVSAVVSGIYAGDISELSARACLGQLWHMERKYGSILRGLWSTRNDPVDADVQRIQQELLNTSHTSSSSSSSSMLRKAVTSSIYTFERGLEMLPNTMARALQQQYSSDRYTLHLNSTTKSIAFDNDSVKINLENGSQLQADQVVSTIPARIMHQLLDDNNNASISFKQLDTIAANVAVVNLVYPGRLPIPNGFGYLIPTIEPNTAALGVVFDSQATTPGSSTDTSSRYTRITVMLGGRYRWQSEQLDNWTENDFLRHALQTVRQHLGVQHEPIHHLVSIHRQCIPQYRVGHIERLRVLHENLPRHSYGRLAVTGASYLGVSINDCIWHAEQLAQRIAAINNTNATSGGNASTMITGLESVTSM